jgi:hypothetical protein
MQILSRWFLAKNIYIFVPNFCILSFYVKMNLW